MRGQFTKLIKVTNGNHQSIDPAIDRSGTMMLQLLKEKYFSRIIFIITFFLALYLYNHLVSTSYRYSRDTQMRMAVVRSLGGPAIPIIAQCCTSRNLAEGIYARRSDLPGGFCFHSDCDVVATPRVISENVYTLKVIHNKS